MISIMKRKLISLCILFSLLAAFGSVKAATFQCYEYGVPQGSTAYDFIWVWNSLTINGASSGFCCDYTDVCLFWAYDIFTGFPLYQAYPLYRSPFPAFICSISLAPSCCCGSYGGTVDDIFCF